jgi:2-phospho-L-lactate guanylyltransferase
MNVALVPVRGLAAAKKRLASTLTLAEREGLALAMLVDMIDALGAARSLDRVVVVSSDDELLRHAGAAGAEIMREQEPRGLNAAFLWAALALEAEGVERLLTIPGDVPLIDPVEVDTLMAGASTAAPVLLVPSAHATGTNGLVTSPPTVISSRFEGESLQAHLEVCREQGVAARVVACRSFELDIDTPHDLLQLASAPGDRRSQVLARTCRSGRSVSKSAGAAG